MCDKCHVFAAAVISVLLDFKIVIEFGSLFAKLVTGTSEEDFLSSLTLLKGYKVVSQYSH